MRRKKQKGRSVLYLGPLTCAEMKSTSAERNAAALPDVCAMVSPGLPEFAAERLDHRFRYPARTGGPTLMELPEVSMAVDDKNVLKTAVRCRLDYGGIQGLVSYVEETSLGHIPFTFLDEVRRGMLRQTVEKRLDHAATAIFRNAPPFYPSLKHGDPEFESHFEEVTYHDFDQRMKRKTANRLLHQLTCTPNRKDSTAQSILPDLIQQTEQRIQQRIDQLCAQPSEEGMTAPIGFQDVTYKVGSISHNLRFHIEADAHILYPSVSEKPNKASKCTEDVHVKTAVQLPLRFARIQDPKEGLAVLRECLAEGQEKLLDGLAEAVSCRSAVPVIDAARTDDQECESEKASNAEADAPPKETNDSDNSKSSSNTEEKSSSDGGSVRGYRKKSPRHVLVAEADVSREVAMRIFSMSNVARLFKNKLIEVFKPRVDELSKDEEYLKLRKKYGKRKKELSDLVKDSPEYKKKEKELKADKEELQQMQEKAGLTWELVRQEHMKIRSLFPLTSVLALTAAEDVWSAIESVLYRSGRTIHFGKYGEHPILRAKQFDGEIIFRIHGRDLQFSMNLMPTHDKRRAVEAVLRRKAQEEKRQKCLDTIRKKQQNNEPLTDAEAVLLADPDMLPELDAKEKEAVRKKRNADCWEQITFGLRRNPQDRFLQDEISHVIGFMQHPEVELEAVRMWAESGKKLKLSTFRPCYAALSCERIRGRYRVFVHITIDGMPCPKYKKDGSPRHTYGTGQVGVDLGTQSIASVSDSAVRLENLAERSGKSTFASEAKEKKIKRYMDRSRRASNPGNYNPDGTCKKGKKTWRCSRSYTKALWYLRNLERKNACSRKYAINQKAWELRAEGDTLIIEPNCVKAWAATGEARRRHEREEAARKAKEATPVTSTAGSAESQKKRGHRRKATNKNRCPGAMNAKLEQVFKSTNGEYIKVDKMFRASQYDHEQNQNKKKKLRERWHVLGSSKRKVQRDAYSAFLLYCTRDDHKAPDQKLCMACFDKFWARHNNMIQEIINSHRKVCNSGIQI